jgi:hypothetical protein
MAEDAGHAVMPVAAGFDTENIPHDEIKRQIEEADAYIASSIDVALSRYLVPLVLDQVVRRAKRLVRDEPACGDGVRVSSNLASSRHLT